MSLRKQYLSLNQIKELNINNLNKLIPMLSSPYWRDAERETLVYTNEVLGNIRQWCTIGRMIELIHYNTVEMYMDYDSDVKKWFVEMKLGTETNFQYKNFSDNDLTDALWQCVKYILLE